MPIAKWGIVLESRLIVQKNGWKTKCLSIVLLHGSLIWLFCETTLNVIHIPAKLANLIFFSFLLNCATSYLSINLGQLKQPTSNSRLARLTQVPKGMLSREERREDIVIKTRRRWRYFCREEWFLSENGQTPRWGATVSQANHRTPAVNLGRFWQQRSRDIVS